MELPGAGNNRVIQLYLELTGRKTTIFIISILSRRSLQERHVSHEPQQANAGNFFRNNNNVSDGVSREYND